ncbi:MAG: FAD-dependent oxidoreductase [Kofleriaceae bacterium]
MEPLRSEAILPSAVDVAVLGAGFAGAATTRALVAGGGLTVALLEQAPQLGAFASGRSVGMGRQLAEDDATTALTVEGARALRAEGATRGLWSESGGLLTFDDEAHLARYVARAAAFAVPCEPLTAAALHHRGVAAPCGLWVPSDGLIDVRAYLGWLVDEAVRGGAQLRLDTRVLEVPPPGRDGGVALRTSRGALRARVVVDATGAWAGSLVGRPLKPLRRHVFAVGAPEAPAGPHGGPPRAAALPAPSLARPFLWHVGPEEVYLRPTATQWLVSPCDEREGEPGDQTLSPDAEPELRRRLARFPGPWRDAEVVDQWSCQRTFGPNGRMLIARDATHGALIWAAGLGGHGATAAAAVGARAAAAVRAALRESLPA